MHQQIVSKCAPLKSFTRKCGHFEESIWIGDEEGGSLQLIRKTYFSTSKALQILLALRQADETAEGDEM